MNKLHLKIVTSFFMISFLAACKPDKPVYPAGTVAISGIQSTQTGIVTDSTNATTGNGNSVANGGTIGTHVAITGDGLPLGGVNTITYKINGITTTAASANFTVKFPTDTSTGKVYLIGYTPVSFNMDFIGFTPGVYDIDDLNIGSVSAKPGGKVKLTLFRTTGYLGVLQGTFQADMFDANTSITYNDVVGSFNIQQ